MDDHSLFEAIIDNIPFGYIDKSSVHGYGLFAKADLPEGMLLGVLDGQVMPWNDYDQTLVRIKQHGKLAPELFFEWNALSPDTLLVRPLRTKYSFINHSRNPNLVLRGYPLHVETLRSIAKGEELFLDYRKEPLSEEYLNGHGSTYL